MSIKKTLSVATVTLLSASLLAAPVSAQSPQQAHNVGYIAPESISYGIISPFWSETSSAVASIHISNRNITSGMSVVAQNSATRISGTMFLERNVNGSWTRVQSWAVSGTGVLNASRTATASAGGTYRTRFVVTVGSERIERTSASQRA